MMNKFMNKFIEIRSTELDASPLVYQWGAFCTTKNLDDSKVSRGGLSMRFSTRKFSMNSNLN